MEKNDVGTLSYSMYKINSKWIKDINIRLQTVQNLGSKHEMKPSRHLFWQLFLGYNTKAKATKVK